ncbi:cytokine-dependent hematopoietic cell linker isoform X3 [Sapajus apella]|uniref:Cytokine-dependent hematopoietic cell linker isoform X3 n=1 Tax=Sapajus apella TaxID=9515 RepID=A0A6J3HDC5_SAPAP|nr:cytokine-dependent hematopoietic cell linker isoform X3 [Sapajus apella]
MNRQGNRRTTKGVSNDLKFQNLSLPKNRSWPHLTSDTGQYQRINKPLPGWERNFPAVLDGAKSRSNDDYEDPELQMEETWQSIKILPARPIKESEYADTRYFKGAMDTSLLLDTRTSIPIGQQAWNTQTKLERVNKPISKDIRSQNIKGDTSLRKNKIPLPPPRQINLRDLSEVLEAEKVPHNQRKPESTHLLQNKNTQEIPLAISSSSFITSNHNVQNRDHRGGMQSCSPHRCQSPASCTPHENVPPYKYRSWRLPFPERSDRKDIQHNEWYVGEYSRQEVEEALMKENKDGTFLVRDCSTKSKEEPYVLVVFNGNKVYNVKIRFLERNQQFALGTGLRGDEKFDSVEAIIEHFKYFPIILIDGKDKTGAHRKQCYLTQPLSLTRHFSPL